MLLGTSSSKESLCDPIELSLSSSSDSREILSGSSRRIHSPTALAGVKSLLPCTCNGEDFVLVHVILGLLACVQVVVVVGGSIPILCKNLDLILSADDEQGWDRGTFILVLHVFILVEVALPVLGTIGGDSMLK